MIRADNSSMLRRARAGRSAARIYREGLHAWRRTVRRDHLIVALVASLGALPVWLYAPHREFYTGLWLGAVFGMLQWSWYAPPHFIARWKDGSEGERQTEKALRALEREGWHVRHDLSAAPYGNVDHVVHGRGGMFLLDTKSLTGVLSIEDGVLSCHHPANPKADYSHPKLARAMWGASRALKKRVHEKLGWIVDVHPVVVLWAAFPEMEGEIDGVKVIHGSKLVEWLQSQPRRIADVDHAPVARALAALPLAE